MTVDVLTGPATPGELEKLAASYQQEAEAETRLATSLDRQDGMRAAADNNRYRARRHARTAEILREVASARGARAA